MNDSFPPKTSSRIPAIDWMRGIVIILMTIDHASMCFNSDRLVSDAYFLYKPGTYLDPAQFFTRWITHLCAPAFVFLAGVSLAINIEKRVSQGEKAKSIDQYILSRGLIIFIIEVVWMSLVFPGKHIILQVLYAIGISFIFMIPLRRLRTSWIFFIALVAIFFNELLVGLFIHLNGGEISAPIALFFSGGVFEYFIVGYPLFPWLGIMLLGWVLGKFLLYQSFQHSPEKILFIGGALFFLLFLVIRGFNDLGNMLLLRDNHSLIQWLHVSKYPPSASYITLELSIMAFLLAFCFSIQRLNEKPINKKNPLYIFGQSALFFYVLHIHLLALAAKALGMYAKSGLLSTYIATVLLTIALYPLCLLYRKHKTSHPKSWLRFI